MKAAQKTLPNKDDPLMRRDIFSDEHDMLRDQFRRFVADKVEPKIDAWNRGGTTDRESGAQFGAAGYLLSLIHI